MLRPLACFLAITSLAGCSSTRGTAVTEAEVRRHLDEASFRLPLDEPRSRVGALVNLMDYAVRGATRACLLDRGFAAPASTYAPHQEPPPLSIWARTDDELRRLALRPPASDEAATFAAQLDTLIASTPGFGQANEWCSDHLLGARYLDVALAVTREYDLFSTTLARPAIEQATGSTAYRRALREWAACMRQRGFDVDDEEELSRVVGSSDAGSATGPSEGEVQAALAARACDQASGQRRSYYRALVRAELEQLAAHPAAVSELDERLAKLHTRIEAWADRVGVDLPA